MFLNPGKCYYITFGLNTIKNELILEHGTVVPSTEEHVALRITINSRLKQLSTKFANKLNVLTRIVPYLSHNQRRLIYISFLLDNEATAY